MSRIPIPNCGPVPVFSSDVLTPIVPSPDGVGLVSWSFFLDKFIVVVIVGIIFKIFTFYIMSKIFYIFVHFCHSNPGGLLFHPLFFCLTTLGSFTSRLSISLLYFRYNSLHFRFYFSRLSVGPLFSPLLLRYDFFYFHL